MWTLIDRGEIQGLKGTLLIIFLSDNPNRSFQDYLFHYPSLAQTHCVLLPFQIQVLSPSHCPCGNIVPALNSKSRKGRGEEGRDSAVQWPIHFHYPGHVPRTKEWIPLCSVPERGRGWISWKDHLVWPIKSAGLYQFQEVCQFDKAFNLVPGCGKTVLNCIWTLSVP